MLGVVVHGCNLSTWETEAGGSQVWGQPGLHRKKKKLQLFNCKIITNHWISKLIANYIITASNQYYQHIITKSVSRSNHCD
jgi:hypothetical protein